MTAKKRLELRSLHEAKLIRRHIDSPNASKGLEGLLNADELLKLRESRGLLIGGLSRAVWNKNRTPENLYLHKDVDVVVFDSHFDPSYLEGGIDWWIPKSARIETASSIYPDARWYENGNDVVLGFNPELKYDLSPGLYIMDPKMVVDMEAAEAEAFTDSNVFVDDEVIKMYRKNVAESMGKCLPEFILSYFSEKIISEKYNSIYGLDYVTMIPQNLELLRGINRYKKEN
jgi:hypothetical protein